MLENLIDEADRDRRLVTDSRLTQEYDRLRATLRIQEWIDKDNIFQTHIINAVVLKRCEYLKSPADRDNLGDQEEKYRSNEKGTKFH
ncbi:MAG: hypothetical protein C0507_20425 [Cyanobacteria bacterium PR.3.49]|nr:hypothetical protein [Cyanobacteria bacterium PR.3.49]